MLSAFLRIEKTEIKYNMKQIYYVIRTLLRGAWFQRYQNPLFGVGADDEHPVVCPRGFRTEL
jgi:hypothetical protein